MTRYYAGIKHRDQGKKKKAACSARHAYSIIYVYNEIRLFCAASRCMVGTLGYDSRCVKRNRLMKAMGCILLCIAAGSTTRIPRVYIVTFSFLRGSCRLFLPSIILQEFIVEFLVFELIFTFVITIF